MKGGREASGHSEGGNRSNRGGNRRRRRSFIEGMLKAAPTCSPFSAMNCSARSTAALIPPAAVTWLSLIIIMSYRPMRWLTPPPEMGGVCKGSGVVRVQGW
jgi:hypothetical protein